MLISLQLASGNTAIDINDIWKVQETDTGCKVSAGTDVYSSSTLYADVLAAGASKLVEVALTGGDTVALNIDHVKTVYENPAGGVSIVLNNGKVLTSSTDFDDFVASQPSVLGAVSVQTEDFIANGASGTVYLATPESTNIEATLVSSPIGTRYTFLCQSADGSRLEIYPADGETIRFYDVDTVREVTGGSSQWLEVDDAGSVQIVKDSATRWSVVSLNAASFNE